MSSECQLQFPSALHALRAPQLRSANLTASLGWQGSLRPPGWRAGSYGQKYSAMPVHAKDLAWLLHHPCLEEVTITATKVKYNSMTTVLNPRSMSCM